MIVSSDKETDTDRERMEEAADLPERIEEAFQRASNKPNWAGVVEFQPDKNGKMMVKALTMTKSAKTGKVTGRRVIIL